MRGSVEADERFLNEVFSRIPIVGEEARQSHQCSAFLIEQPNKKRIAIEPHDGGHYITGPLRRHEKPSESSSALAAGERRCGHAISG